MYDSNEPGQKNSECLFRHANSSCPSYLIKESKMTLRKEYVIKMTEPQINATLFDSQIRISTAS